MSTPSQGSPSLGVGKNVFSLLPGLKLRPALQSSLHRPSPRILLWRLAAVPSLGAQVAPLFPPRSSFFRSREETFDSKLSSMEMSRSGPLSNLPLRSMRPSKSPMISAPLSSKCLFFFENRHVRILSAEETSPPAGGSLSFHLQFEEFVQKADLSKETSLLHRSPFRFSAFLPQTWQILF